MYYLVKCLYDLNHISKLVKKQNEIVVVTTHINTIYSTSFYFPEGKAHWSKDAFQVLVVDKPIIKLIVG